MLGDLEFSVAVGTVMSQMSKILKVDFSVVSIKYQSNFKDNISTLAWYVLQSQVVVFLLMKMPFFLHSFTSKVFFISARF